MWYMMDALEHRYVNLRLAIVINPSNAIISLILKFLISPSDVFIQKSECEIGNEGS